MPYKSINFLINTADMSIIFPTLHIKYDYAKIYRPLIVFNYSYIFYPVVYINKTGSTNYGKHQQPEIYQCV